MTIRDLEITVFRDKELIGTTTADKFKGTITTASGLIVDSSGKPFPYDLISTRILPQTSVAPVIVSGKECLTRPNNLTGLVSLTGIRPGNFEITLETQVTSDRSDIKAGNYRTILRGNSVLPRATLRQPFSW